MMGCDVDWGSANPDGVANAGAAVLSRATENDDGDRSEESGADKDVTAVADAPAPAPAAGTTAGTPCHPSRGW